MLKGVTAKTRGEKHAENGHKKAQKAAGTYL